jgi:hypothetical protein
MFYECLKENLFVDWKKDTYPETSRNFNILQAQTECFSRNFVVGWEKYTCPCKYYFNT